MNSKTKKSGGEIERKTYGTGGLIEPQTHGFKVLAEPQEVGRFFTEQAPHTTNGRIVDGMLLGHPWF